MASPAKRRKINNGAKSSPDASRSLDYFFCKQKIAASSRDANGVEDKHTKLDDTSRLADEQMARTLQAEWDREALSLSEEGASNGKGIPRAKLTDGQPLPLAGPGTRPEDDGMYIAEDIVRIESEMEGKSEAEPKAMSSSDSRSKNTLSLQSTVSAEDTISSTIPFDESPLIFDPQRFVPQLQRHWAIEGNDASYAILTRCFVLVNSTQSRIKIVDTLVNFLRTIIEADPSSLLPAVRICLGLLNRPYRIHSMHLIVESNHGFYKLVRTK
jgi:DNA ligase-1